MDLSAKCGLPGVVSSMDVVYVKYDRCQWAQRSLSTGKEGFLTLGYQVHSGHNRVVYWMSGWGFPGSRNDKTIQLYDDFLDKLKNDAQFCNKEYVIKVAQGRLEVSRVLAHGAQSLRPRRRPRLPLLPLAAATNL